MEVYGTKPKRFTKEWWQYFWDYYKIHTISSVLAIFVIISTVSECKKQINYDLQIDVITRNSVSQEALDILSNTAREKISDVTGNGENEVYVSYIDMGIEGDPQLMEAMHTKMMIETGYTEAFIFFVSKEYADYMSDTGVFKPASEWTSAKSYNGYCIDLKGCETIENMGFDTSDLYLGIVELRERDKVSEREKNRPKQENGINFAKFLLNEE